MTLTLYVYQFECVFDCLQPEHDDFRILVVHVSQVDCLKLDIVTLEFEWTAHTRT